MRRTSAGRPSAGRTPDLAGASLPAVASMAYPRGIYTSRGPTYRHGRPNGPPCGALLCFVYSDSVSSLSMAMTCQIVARSKYSRLRLGSCCCSAISAHSAARVRHSSANNVLIGKIGTSGALLRRVYFHRSVCACEEASQAFLGHTPSAELVEGDITVVHKFAHPLFETGIVVHIGHPRHPLSEGSSPRITTPQLGGGFIPGPNGTCRNSSIEG